MPDIVFQCQDKTKSVEKRYLFCLNKYLDEYTTKDRIVMSDSCDFEVFCIFMDFLVSGHIPSDRNDQIGVINLLREWESHFGIVDSFRFRLCCQEKDGIVVYNGDKYEVNIGCLLFHSDVFREFYKNSCGMVFNFESSYSRESFEVFLDLIHNRISYPSVEKAGDVYDICNCLHCDSLCQLLNDDSSERVLSLLIQNQDQNESNIDFSKYERSITQKIETYLKNPSFCLVSLPSLCRIFAASNQIFSLFSLESFLIGCIKHHGTGAKILLNNIKYQKPSELSELNRFLHIMSIEGTSDIYDNSNDVLSSFQREFSSLREEIWKISQKYEQNSNEMNIKLKEQNKIIDKLKKEIISDKTIIEKQNNVILENKRMLDENSRLIQSKDATINEQLTKIKHLNEKEEFLFISDPFSGIFDGISKKLGVDIYDSAEVDVIASSVYNDDHSTYGPRNVLKNDDSYWYSYLEPNSWIQFDFMKRNVSITSYSMNDQQRIKSWKVGGSTDGSIFDIIDNKEDISNFMSSYDTDMNFPVHSKNKYYRFIRITFNNENYNYDDDYLELWRVELFGFVKLE